MDISGFIACRSTACPEQQARSCLYMLWFHRRLLLYTQSHTLQPRSLAAPRYAIVLQDQLEFLHFVQKLQLRYPTPRSVRLLWV